MNALGYLQEELKLLSIPTSSLHLDEAFCNGIRLGSITEIVGYSGTGKTQLCIQLLFNTILPEPLGIIDGKAVYISTRPNNFCPQRINQVADYFVDILKSKTGNLGRTAKEFTREKALERILHKRVESTAALLSTVYQLKKFMRTTKNIRLIVIDSYSVLLRDLEHLERIRVDYEILDLLQSIAVDNECAVVLTNTLTPDITGSLSDAATPMKPVLGYAHHHRIQQRLLLTKERNGKVIAGVQKNLTGRTAVVKLKITKSGISDG